MKYICQIYMSGGFYNALQTKFSDVLYAYNTHEKQWKVIAEMPDERGAHIMIQRGDYPYGLFISKTKNGKRI